MSTFELVSDFTGHIICVFEFFLGNYIQQIKKGEFLSKEPIFAKSTKWQESNDFVKLIVKDKTKIKRHPEETKEEKLLR